MAYIEYLCEYQSIKAEKYIVSNPTPGTEKRHIRCLFSVAFG